MSDKPQRPAKKVRKPAPDEDIELDDDDAPRPKKKKAGVETIIPYKNGLALGAYYCGVFGLIPILGFLLGLVAIVLGVLGLKAAANKPKVGGKGHAITGIILGVVDLVIWPAVGLALGWFAK
jgi:hypothetical protein